MLLSKKVDSEGNICIVNDANKMVVQARKGGMGFDGVLAISPLYVDFSENDITFVCQTYGIKRYDFIRRSIQRGYYTDTEGKDIAVVFDMTLDRYEP